jgi:hypothetical protein
MYPSVVEEQVSANTFSTRDKARAANMRTMSGDRPERADPEVYPDKAHGQSPVGAIAERWIEKHDVPHNVRLSYKSYLNTYIIPRLGAIAIGEVTTGELAECSARSAGSGSLPSPQRSRQC